MTEALPHSAMQPDWTKDSWCSVCTSGDSICKSEFRENFKTGRSQLKMEWPIPTDDTHCRNSKLPIGTSKNKLTYQNYKLVFQFSGSQPFKGCKSLF